MGRHLENQLTNPQEVVTPRLGTVGLELPAVLNGKVVGSLLSYFLASKFAN